jgi:hypothetical protein
MSKILPTEQAYPNARVMEGGVLVFIRGEPPRSIQGYKQDPTDRTRFIPLLKPCIFRTITWRKVCGAMVQKIACSKFSIDVRMIDCLDCADRKETP